MSIKKGFLSRTEVQKLVKIIHTEHNLNSCYGAEVKNVWRRLAAMGATYTDIAKVWGADRRTVRSAIDSDYREHVRNVRVKANKNYRDRNPEINEYWTSTIYRNDLIDRKIKLLEGNNNVCIVQD